MICNRELLAETPRIDNSISTTMRGAPSASNSRSCYEDNFSTPRRPLISIVDFPSVDRAVRAEPRDASGCGMQNSCTCTATDCLVQRSSFAKYGRFAAGDQPCEDPASCIFDIGSRAPINTGLRAVRPVTCRRLLATCPARAGLLCMRVSSDRHRVASFHNPSA